MSEKVQNNLNKKIWRKVLKRKIKSEYSSLIDTNVLKVAETIKQYAKI